MADTELIPRVEQRYKEHPKTMDRDGDYTDIEISYVVFDAEDEDAALKAVHPVALEQEALFENDLLLDTLEIDSRENETTFFVNATFKTDSLGAVANSDEEDDEAKITFDCSGGTKKLLRSLKQTILIKDAPNPHGFINWNGKMDKDREVAGVDVVTATMRETYVKTIPRSRLTNEYKRTLARLTGTVNAVSFKKWKVGEVLFLGASFTGAEKGRDKVQVTFNFAIQENEAFELNGQKLSKKGWEYVWTISDTVDEGGKPVVKLIGMYGDRVYAESDFGQLKI